MVVMAINVMGKGLRSHNMLEWKVSLTAAAGARNKSKAVNTPNLGATVSAKCTTAA